MKLISKSVCITLVLLVSIIFEASANNFKYCFDQLDHFNTAQIERIYQFKVESVANTQPATDIFECYLRETRPKGLKSDTEKYFDVYRKCNEYRKKLLYVDMSHIDQLESLGLPKYLEEHVREGIRSGPSDANDILTFIQKELNEKIELSPEYSKYRELVYAKKLQTLRKSGQKSVYNTGLTQFLIVFALIFLFRY